MSSSSVWPCPTCPLANLTQGAIHVQSSVLTIEGNSSFLFNVAGIDGGEAGFLQIPTLDGSRFTYSISCSLSLILQAPSTSKRALQWGAGAKIIKQFFVPRLNGGQQTLGDLVTVPDVIG